ncbi:histidine kinase N-terminal 7TM domain-containing protein [Methanoregula sp.]|uniref:histidine kinase N-terminal 7TM domain-containing protein n=1 Tax=Methanoregula sp. TaxID=2052170 RepID=UPI003C76B298
MNIQFTPLVVLMLVSGTVSAALTIIGWRNRTNPISQPFILLMAAETVWIFGYAMEMMSTRLSTVLLLNNIEYPALLTVPVAWFFIVMCYTGREQYLTRRSVPLFFIVPALVYLMVLTNQYHYLYYSGFHAETVNGSVIWIYEHGPLFWITIAYCYAIALVALTLAGGRLFGQNKLYRNQTILLFCAAVIPALCNMAYVFRFAPFPDYDLTPIAFLIAGIILAVGILRYRLFSAVPVAYSRVFATMRDGVIVVDRQYCIIDINPAAERITGFSSHVAVGLDITDLVPLLKEVGGSAASGGERRAEIHLPYDGYPHYFDILFTPMDNSGAGSSGYLCLFRDVTERKQAELALASANRNISLLTSITRHDLNNKLMAVRSYIELIRELATDPIQKEYLDLEERAVQAMREQIEFTREYQQLGVESPVWQDVNALIRRALAQLDLNTIRLENNTGSFEVFADPMLEKVFYNLFDNAMRYGGDQMTTLNISSSPDGNEMVLVVGDDGAGIPAAERTRLFERGFGRNTGLGLFLSREILAITNITINETGMGRGARFEIRVPMANYRHHKAEN